MKASLSTIDPVSIGVSDFARSLAFYDTVLVELGCKRGMDIDIDGKKAAGYSPNARPMLCIGHLEGCMNAIAPSFGFPLAFPAKTRNSMDAFYTKFKASGAHDNGKPGLKPQYHPNDVAFMANPDGSHLEAVCHQPQPSLLIDRN